MKTNCYVALLLLVLAGCTTSNVDRQTSSSVENNKALIRRFYEQVWNKGDLAVVDETFAPDYVRHDPGGTQAGLELQRRTASVIRAAFPDLRMTIDFMLGERDLVAARWTIRGTHTGPLGPNAATGKPVDFSGINIFRIQGAKVVEIWNHRDDLSMFRQLGIQPPSGPRQ